jgi:hypothetical protein
VRHFGIPFYLSFVFAEALKKCQDLWQGTGRWDMPEMFRAMLWKSTEENESTGEFLGMQKGRPSASPG